MRVLPQNLGQLLLSSTKPAEGRRSIGSIPTCLGTPGSPVPTRACPRPRSGVWAANITCLPMARGFLYLVAVMDWYSRYVLACLTLWRPAFAPRRLRSASSSWTNPHKTTSNATPGASPTYIPTTPSVPIWALTCLHLRRLSLCTISRERLSID